MLYYLSQFLEQFDIPGIGVFKYISFRTGAAFILSMLISTIIGRQIINRLQLMQIGEVVRDLGLEGQMSKKGTPTMGGIIIIISILVPILLLGRLDNIYLILLVVTTIWLGTVGFIDDYIKVFKKNKEGLHGRFKIVGQVGLGLIVGLTMWLSPSVVVQENREVLHNNEVQEVQYEKYHAKSTLTSIPFMKNNNFDYSKVLPFLKGRSGEVAGWIVFIFATILIVTAVSNGANLTDGLDGLATGSSAIIGATLGVLAYLSSHIAMASYLNIMYIPGCEEMVVFSGAFIGATVGFLWYNSYPAQVFMGDTGSLMLGGIIAVFAIMIRKELLIPVLCGVFLLENLSVVLQVVYFKYTKRRFGEGKRIFKMTPLHHHFQKPGGMIPALLQSPMMPIPESKIVVRFWIVGIILAAITIVTLKLR